MTDTQYPICNEIPKDFSSDIETVSVDMARGLLSDVEYIKLLKDNYTKEIIEKINNNEYYFHGSPIIISTEGSLLSGHEILAAIIATNMSLLNVVSRNVPKEYYTTIDLFSPRHTKDEMSIYNKFSEDREDDSNINKIYASIKVMSAFKDGVFIAKVKDSKEVFDFYIEFKKNIDSIYKYFNKISLYSEKEKKGSFCSTSILMGFIFVISHPKGDNVIKKENFQKAFQFLQNICEPDYGYDENDPSNQAIEEYRRFMKELRVNKTIVFGSSKKATTAKKNDHIYWLIKTWNAWIKQEPLELKPAPVSINKIEQTTKINYEIKIEDNNFTFHSNHIEVKNTREILNNDSEEPSVEIKLITPLDAKAMLQYNHFNRKVKEATVKRYAQEMEEGRWKFNGESIKISIDGEVLDAQHRLRACLLSGQSFYTLLVKNVNPNAFDMYDRKKPNNLANMLNEEYGVKNLSALINLYNHILHNDRSWWSDNNVILKLAEDNQGILYYNERYKKLKHYIPGAKNIFTVLHYCFSSIDKAMAEDFMNRLLFISDEDSEKYEKIFRKFISKHELISRNELYQQGIINIIISLWNDVYAGQETNEKNNNLYILPRGSKYIKIEGFEEYIDG